MNRLKTVLAAPIALAAAAALPATAVAQQADCVSRAEARAVTANLMPDLLQSAGERCGRVLGGSSFLAQNDDRLAAKLQPTADASWATARGALERLGGNPLPDNEALVDMGRKLLANGITKDLDREACGFVNDLTRELAPLPPRNFVNIFSLFLEAGINGNDESPIKVCKTPRR